LVRRPQIQAGDEFEPLLGVFVVRAAEGGAGSGWAVIGRRASAMVLVTYISPVGTVDRFERTADLCPVSAEDADPLRAVIVDCGDDGRGSTGVVLIAGPPACHCPNASKNLRTLIILREN
jgi:hypothetical protein